VQLKNELMVIAKYQQVEVEKYSLMDLLGESAE